MTVDPKGVCPVCKGDNPACIMCAGSGELAVSMGGIPKPKETNPVAKYFDASKPSRAAAVKAKCCECMGVTRTDVEPGFRALIRDCDAGPAARAPCALFHFRPFQRADADDEGDAE